MFGTPVPTAGYVSAVIPSTAVRLRAAHLQKIFHGLVRRVDATTCVDPESEPHLHRGTGFSVRALNFDPIGLSMQAGPAEKRRADSNPVFV